MRKRSLQVLRAVVVIGVVAAIAGAATPGHAKGISYQSLNKIQRRLISGGLAMSLAGATPTSKASAAETCGSEDPNGDEPDEAPSCPPDSYTPAPGPGGGAGSASGYSPSGNGGCAVNRGNNIKVNAGVPDHFRPGSPGSRPGAERGVDRGRSGKSESPRREPERLSARRRQLLRRLFARRRTQRRNDSTVPMSFTRGSSSPREYWQAGGDTSVGWDTRGNAYISCQLFNRGSGTSPEPRPVERVRDHAIDAERRRLVELPGPLVRPRSSIRPATARCSRTRR